MRFGRYIVGLPTTPEKRPSPEPRLADLLHDRWLENLSVLSSKHVREDATAGESPREAAAEQRS